jgi:predicted dehydrogenase
MFEYPEALAVIDISWKAHGLQQGGVLFIGDAGEAWFEGRMTRGEASRYRVTAGDTVIFDERRSPTEDYVEAFYLLEREFADAMLGRTVPGQLAVNNLQTLELTFTAYKVARRDQPASP